MRCGALSVGIARVLSSTLRRWRALVVVPSGRKMRILIIDDNHDTADMLSMLLAAAGHEVRAAYRGDEALVLAASFVPHLALVDIQLTDTTGFALARKLRKQFGKRIHLVAITGGDARSLPFAGVFDQHATKPVTAARLYQTIDIARDALRN